MEAQAIIALVIGIIAIIQQWSRTGLYQTIQDKIQENWRQSLGR